MIHKQGFTLNTESKRSAPSSNVLHEYLNHAELKHGVLIKLIFRMTLILSLIEQPLSVNAQMFGLTKTGGMKINTYDQFSNYASKSAKATSAGPAEVPDNVDGTASATVDLNLSNKSVTIQGHSSFSTASLTTTGFTTDGSDVLAPATLSTSAKVKAIKGMVFDNMNPYGSLNPDTGNVQVVPNKEVVYKAQVYVELTRQAKSTQPTFIQNFANALR